LESDLRKLKTVSHISLIIWSNASCSEVVAPLTTMSLNSIRKGPIVEVHS